MNGTVAMTLDKLPNIRGDLVRNDSDWEKWDYIQLTEAQPRKPGSFTSARRYSKDPGALWSREPPDFRGNSNCRLFAT